MARRSTYAAVKRAGDAACSLLALIVLSPLLAITALAVLVSSGRPVLFRQPRAGRDAQVFTMFKFRTMRGSSWEGVQAVASDVIRLTCIGRVLRRWSLDELPELVNILRGEMSFVGPRPLLVEYLPLYSAKQARRHDVRPGLTGLAQVSGRNLLDWDERFDLDVYYVDHMSLELDLTIIARTIGAVFTRTGISDESSATMTPFGGNEGSD